jgi:hypothetical protein
MGLGRCGTWFCSLGGFGDQCFREVMTVTVRGNPAGMRRNREFKFSRFLRVNGNLASPEGFES